MSNYALIELDLSAASARQYDLNQRLEASKALSFLRDHPAFCNQGGDSVCNGLWFMMAPCCKHGISEDGGKHGVIVYNDDPKWNEYTDLLDDDSDEPIKSITVPYERRYGEPWSYDHMEYWYEMTFFVFTGNPWDEADSWKMENYNRYAGPEGGANSFEEMLIVAAKEVKKVFGDFQLYHSFYTEAELKNQETVEPMFSKPCEDHKGYSEIIFNDDYVRVGDGLLNLRWLKWFIETDYAKANWEYSFPEWQGILEKLDQEPQKRKDLLK